jgi:hypothetical protein
MAEAQVLTAVTSGPTASTSEERAEESTMLN